MRRLKKTTRSGLSLNTEPGEQVAQQGRTPLLGGAFLPARHIFASYSFQSFGQPDMHTLGYCNPAGRRFN